MTIKELKEEFERQLMIARQLELFGNNPTDHERDTAERRLREISMEIKGKKH